MLCPARATHMEVTRAAHAWRKSLVLCGLRIELILHEFDDVLANVWVAHSHLDKGLSVAQLIHHLHLMECA